MKKYIIGIDGGGTSTLGVLFDLSGNEIKRIEKEFANFSVDVELSEEHIQEAIQELYNGNETEIEMISMGIAGYTNYPNKESFVRMLEGKYQTKVTMVTDAEIALYSVKKEHDKDVIMILGGTGSVVMVGNEEGIKFIGGFGHLLGDEGSGYHLAVTALKNIINQFENGKKETTLTKAILKKIGAEDYSQIKNFVYNNKKSEIAKLSMYIAKYAKNNDKEAIRLFVNEGVLLADQALKAYKTLHSHKEVLIGIKGGFLLQAPYVKETVISEIKKYRINYILDDNPVEPVYGTYYLAIAHLKKR